MSSNDVERIALIREWPQVRGLQMVVTETAAHPRVVTLAIVAPGKGQSDVVRIDSTDPGAKARAISLGDILHDVLETAEMAWFDRGADHPPEGDALG